jgi:hypothetical protein
MIISVISENAFFFICQSVKGLETPRLFIFYVICLYEYIKKDLIYTWFINTTFIKFVKDV